MKQLSGMDASFVYFETPNAPGHIFSVWIYDQSSAPGGKVTFKGILDHVGRRLHVSRTFRQRLVEVPLGLDHPYWIEDPDFDLEYHVRHIALPRPGDWRQFCIQVARLHSRPLDRSRPLWEMYVIEGLDDVAGLPAGSFAIMTKIHHAAIDGVTLLEITSALNDVAPDAPEPAATGEWHAERLPSSLELLSRAAVNTAVRPMRMARLTAAAVPGTAAADARAAGPPELRPGRGLAGAEDPVQRRRHDAPGRRGAPVRAGHRQGDQGRRAGGHDQRRRHHRRRWRVA